MSSARAWLQLARISNTPTVVSNTIAGAVLAVAAPSAGVVAAVAVAMALFYTAGMVLNDVADEAIDRRERPERPIPSGAITRTAALTAFGVLVVGGLAILAAEGWRALAAGAGLVVLIVVYDLWHKGNALSPVLMGACRALVYVIAGFAVADTLPWELWAGAGMLLVYIVGLTQVAKAEATGRSSAWPTAAVLAPVIFWAFLLPSPESFLTLAAFLAWVLWALRLVRSKRIGPAVGAMIAGVSLFDAVAVASADGPFVAVAVCVGAFAVTIALQTKIAGT
jgi:hypothetical protein